MHAIVIAISLLVAPAPSKAMGPSFNCKAPSALLSDSVATVRVCEKVSR